MKIKLFLCLIVTAVILCFSAPVYAHADSVNNSPSAAVKRYARADAKDIYFCKEKDLNTALFTIPYTYCVQVLSSDGEWNYVKYAEDSGLYKALYGYCLSEGLTAVDKPPENIYLNMPVTVTYKTETIGGSLPVLGELNVTAAYYGAYYSGASAYSYVLYENSFGYVHGANDDYPLNEIPDNKPADEPTAAPEKSNPNTKVIVGVVIAAFAVLALAVLYITGRKTRYVRPDK